MKGTGMFIVLLSDVNYRLWSQGVQDKTPICLAIEVLFRVTHKETKKNIVLYSAV